VEAICKELLEVRLGVDWKKRSIPIRHNCVKVISWNGIVVQSEWDRGTFVSGRSVPLFVLDYKF
jgi:hypothetical protein